MLTIITYAQRFTLVGAMTRGGGIIAVATGGGGGGGGGGSAAVVTDSGNGGGSVTAAMVFGVLVATGSGGGSVSIARVSGGGSGAGVEFRGDKCGCAGGTKSTAERFGTEGEMGGVGVTGKGEFCLDSIGADAADNLWTEVACAPRTRGGFVRECSMAACVVGQKLPGLASAFSSFDEPRVTNSSHASDFAFFAEAEGSNLAVSSINTLSAPL